MLVVNLLVTVLLGASADRQVMHGADSSSLLQVRPAVERATESSSSPMSIFSSGFTIRYAAMQPDNSTEYLLGTLLPQLRSSICLTERSLTPALLERFGVAPEYVIFTDSFTHEHVAASFEKVNRIRLVNLDLDASDTDRMMPFESLHLDHVNYASVRRTLADPVHLPVQGARLLLGTDVSFLAPPHELLEDVQDPSGTQAFYMKWRPNGSAPLYRLLNYSGPQCGGMIADFIYLPPGMSMSVELLQEKMRWYAQQPLQTERTEPAMVGPGTMHGIDQFGIMLALAEVASYVKGRCVPLSDRYGHDPPRVSPQIKRDSDHFEVAHDKVVSSCKLPQ